MLTPAIKDEVRAYLEEDIEDSDRNVYLTQFHSSKALTSETLSTAAEAFLGDNAEYSTGHTEEGLFIRYEGSPVLFWEVADERWLLVYGSSINRRIREKISKLDAKVGWLLKVWFQTNVVHDLYQEYSPEDESVNIERQWDPYWLYQQESEIPDHMYDYYSENIDEFVRQEIEFNLKTPKWMVDEALEQGVTRDLLEKSEISKSRFTFQPDNLAVAQDGGVTSDSPTAKVSIRQGGQVVHRTGAVEAVFELVGELESRNNLYDEFDGLVPEREYQMRENGILDISSYQEGRILKIVFQKKEYNEEASLKLSNLLTVGQNDVEIHGIIKSRGDLGFFSESYLAYDNGEADILFTYEGIEDTRRPALFIRPKAGTTSGLLYLFHKLAEKYDPRVTYEIVDDLPLERLTQEIDEPRATSGGWE